MKTHLANDNIIEFGKEDTIIFKYYQIKYIVTELFSK